MRYLASGPLVLGLAFLGLGAPSAAAQGSVAVSLNRPSRNSPSAGVGTVGGFNTRFRRQGSVATGGVAGRGGFGGAPRIRMPRAPRVVGLPSALSPAIQQTAFRFMGSRASPLGGPSAAQLAMMTRYSAGFRMNTPLEGWNIRAAPELRTPLLLMPAESATSPLPAAEPADADLGPSAPRQPIMSLATALEESGERYVRDLETRALTAFREGTQADGEDRPQKLARAMRLFTAVRNLDSQAYLPSLLTIHAALEKKQMERAVRGLVDVLRRHPQIFAEHMDVASYFGDASVLEEQMRRNLSIGDDSGGRPRLYALQTYCAWVLEDTARIRAGLQKLEQHSRGTRDRGIFDVLQHALHAAYR